MKGREEDVEERIGWQAGGRVGWRGSGVGLSAAGHQRLSYLPTMAGST